MKLRVAIDALTEELQGLGNFDLAIVGARDTAQPVPAKPVGRPARS